MTMTDPIADMLTRIRNANIAMHDLTEMPSSKLKVALAEILQQEGYIEGFAVADDPKRPGDKLTITMKYTPDRKRTISGIKRVQARPPRYSAATDVPRVLGGMGIAVLSTNQGLLTDRERKRRGWRGPVPGVVSHVQDR
jgi:small subunit ribosomal protein S8